MTLLTVQTLGVPEVRYQGTKLKFRSRKALALLIYLVVEPGPHSREKLIDLLWSGDLKQGRVSLRTALAQLRQALQAADAPMVVTTYDLVQIDDKRPFHLDLHTITTALRPEAAAADWQAVVNLARGQFLEGFNLLDAPAYEEWVALQRQHWYIQIEQVYQQLTRYHLDCGEEMPAMQLAGRWIAYSPLNETAYHCLMVAQARMGERTAALQTYQQCQEILQAELAIAPGRELTALAERIQQGEMQTAERTHVSPATPQPTPFPFVGRAGEYRQLATALHAVVQGATRITAVIGTAGMGKTHLVEAFLNGAQFDKADVDILQGRAYETGGRLPYQPLVAAFRARLEHENAPEDLLDDVWLAELSQLLPELRARYPDLPSPLTGNADFARARLFEAFAQLGQALAARQPAILFLDDWQWAESSTRDMLHYLTQSWAKTNAPLLLVLTLRQEALLTDAVLQEWLLEIERVTPVTRLELAELTAVAVHQFVQQIAAADPAAKNAIQQFSHWLYQETGGQPFFLHERVKMLVEQGVLPPATGDGRSTFDIPAAWQQLQGQHPLPVPTTVRQALLARQSRLSENALALLWASAVLGRDCTFERLCQVSSVAELAGLSALEELLNGRLIREDRSARRPYTFAHDYIREVAYTEAGEARRRLFHRQALAALEQDNAPAAELAFHALAAQLGEPAFRHSLAAGDVGLKALAHAEALTHYEAARRLFLENRVAGVETAVIQHLYLQIGRALELNNQFDDALATYQQMSELAAQFADERLRLASLTAQCIVHATQTPLYDGAKARICGEEALGSVDICVRFTLI